MRFQDPQRSQRRGTAGRGDGGGKDEGSGRVLHIVDHPLGGRHVSAEGSQRLGEGAHIDVHLILQAVVAGRAASAFADDAEAVGIVHHDPCAVFLCQAADFREIRDVAAHGEHAVRHDEAAGGLRHAPELLLQIVHVVVLEPEHFPEGQPAAVIQARVVLAVHDHIVPATDDGADDAEVRLEAGGEGHHRFLPQESGQLLFQLKVQLQRAVEEARAGTAGAVLLDGLKPRSDHVGVGRQAEIVVGPQHDAALALHHDLGVLAGFQRVEIRVDSLFPDFIRHGSFVAFCEQIHCVLLLRRARQSGWFSQALSFARNHPASGGVITPVRAIFCAFEVN